MAEVRLATPEDRSDILALQSASFRALGRMFYTDLEIESYLYYTPTLEEYLVADSTYYVAHVGERLVGCGGWSVREPAYSAAVAHDVSAAAQRHLPKLRAMFVHPELARRGIGRQLVAAIESAIVADGYDEAGVLATLGGALLYERCGYNAVGEAHAELPNGARLRFVRLHKRLVALRSPMTEQGR